jgi:hypothetical protein
MRGTYADVQDVLVGVLQCSESCKRSIAALLERGLCNLHCRSDSEAEGATSWHA